MPNACNDLGMTAVVEKAHDCKDDSRSVLYDTGMRIRIGRGNNAVRATASVSA